MKKALTSKAILERLPAYLRFLKFLEEEGIEYTSSAKMAKALGYGDVLVRKDLQQISGKGRPKIGYVVSDLLPKVEKYLYSAESTGVILVGVGKLGKALLGFDGFADYGLNISAAFDSDEDKVDEKNNIYHLSQLKEYCNKNKVKLGIITVPETVAQDVCDMMVESGIVAILNFASAKLNVPKGVIVRNENLASSLAVVAGQIL